MNLSTGNSELFPFVRGLHLVDHSYWLHTLGSTTRALSLGQGAHRNHSLNAGNLELSNLILEPGIGSSAAQAVSIQSSRRD